MVSNNPFEKINDADFDDYTVDIDGVIRLLIHNATFKYRHQMLRSGNVTKYYMVAESDGSKRRLEVSAHLRLIEGTINKYLPKIKVSDTNGGPLYKIYFRCISDNQIDTEYAIKIQTLNYTDFKLLLELIYGESGKEVSKSIIDLTVNELNKIPLRDIKSLARWYQHADPIIIATVDRNLCVNHLKIILENLYVRENYLMWRLNTEKAVLNIIRSYVVSTNLQNETNQFNTHAHTFLYRLLNTYIKDESLFNFIYRAINNRSAPLIQGSTNFTTLIEQLLLLWLNSGYSDTRFTLYDNYSGRDRISYSTEKRFGFYSSNLSLEVKNYEIKIEEQVSIGTAKSGAPIPGMEDIGLYHIYQPILVITGDKNKGEMPIPDFTIPTFFLRASADTNEWNNIEKVLNLSIDVATTLTGAGAIYKLRYLRSLGLINAAPIIFESLQVASGFLGVALEFIDDPNDEYAEVITKINTVLLIIDLASLGGELVSKRMLRDHAEKLSETIAELRDKFKKEKKVVDAVEERKLSELESETEKLHQSVSDDGNVPKNALTSEEKLAKELAEESARFVNHKTGFGKLRIIYLKKGLKSIHYQWLDHVKIKEFSIGQLKRYHRTFTNTFPRLNKGCNFATFKIDVITKRQISQTICEVSVSGAPEQVKKIKGFREALAGKLGEDILKIMKPSGNDKIPLHYIDVNHSEFDYEDFYKFAENSFDYRKGRSRFNDSELKFIYNFLKHHIDKGDHFVIEINSLYTVCSSCRRELLMLQEYAKSIGKRIDYKVSYLDKVEGVKELRELQIIQ